MKKHFGNFNGKDVYLYTIKCGNTEADICDLGARLNALRINGTDIVLGFNSAKDCISSGTFAGATIGRVANRIANGRFVLNGADYAISVNNGANHLHGGSAGFDGKLFDVIGKTEKSVIMRYVSKDGEEGYPGTLEFTVKFTIAENSLLMEYSAISDKDTLWCPTNHAYFNLDGENSGDCKNVLLQLNADYYTPVDGGLIPTGEIKAVKGTPFDFTKLKSIGAESETEELRTTLGYDHNFILNGEHAARAESAETNIKLDVYTDMPCLQFYSGGQLSGCDGKTGKYNKRAGFCLEPQYCPNAINMSGFEKPILKKNVEKTHYIKLIIG